MGVFELRAFTINSETKVHLRSAVTTDAQALNALATEIFKTSEYLVTQADEFTSTADMQQKRIENYQTDEGSLLLVVEHDGRLIGMLDFQNGRRRRVQHKGTFGMSVHPEWRGKGVGKVLLNGLIEWVRAHPVIEIINLAVMEENKAGVGLYESCGFEVMGRDPYGIKTGEGHYMTELWMSLQLN